MQIVISIVLWIFAAFCWHKYKQASGKKMMNEVFTEMGGGSFFGGISSGFMSFVWGILAFISGMLAFTLLFA